MNLTKALVAILLVASAGMAQNINISGRVTSASTGIPGALVRLENGGQTATTDANGYFTLATVGVHGQNNQSLPHNLSATINGGVLRVNVQEKSDVEITTFTLQGKAIVSVKKAMEAGSHSLALPDIGAGVYLYKIKAGRSEFLIKGHSFGRVSGEATASFHGPSSNGLAKQAKSAAAINDVIAVTAAGYLEYRVIVTSSDTSGIAIMMTGCAGTVTDADGNVYQAVKIGKQVWTVDYLRTTKLNDGSAIPLVKNGLVSADGYCFYGNTTDADKRKKFGALYTWSVVNTNKLAPYGWHVPTAVEWDTLQNYLITNGFNWDMTFTGNKIAKSLAARADWGASATAGAVGNDVRRNNRTSFSVLPAGYRDSSGGFVGQTANGECWMWSSTMMATRGLGFNYIALSPVSPYLTSPIGLQKCGFSVRLVRDTIASDVDGNIYHIITIGTQRWMVENLKTTKYNDGTAIPLVTDAATWAFLPTDGYCWYKNNITNKDVYGALYNWHAVNTGKLAPKGWHVPTDSEWDTLLAYCGGWDLAGGKLKEVDTTHWESPNSGATNTTGFTALPGGFRTAEYDFAVMGASGYWWSSTAYTEKTSLKCVINYNIIEVGDGAESNSSGLSVRCIQDN